MRRLSTLALSILSLLILLLQSGCKTGDWESEAEALLLQNAELEQRHQQINTSIDSLWDHTTERLTDLLPSDMPPMDREIFLKSRNADHMRMFMSFRQLDPNLQRLVNEAGHHDQFLAAQMHELFLKRQEFERKKFIFLRKLEKQNVSAGRKLAEQFQL